MHWRFETVWLIMTNHWLKAKWKWNRNMAFINDLIGCNWLLNITWQSGCQHGQVGFTTSAWKGSGDVGFLSLRVGYPQNLHKKKITRWAKSPGFKSSANSYEHVLGQPPFVASDSGSDTQGETFLAEQRVAAVATAIRDDLVSVRALDDNGARRIARPVVVERALERQRASDWVEAAHKVAVA